ncbi:hypothetical protein J437_LFUL019572 [Ladona fulva]|nr:hypothetical protein J437_LFUL019572 [Ladona fulva]
MDQDINDWVKECQVCQENRGQEPDVPLYLWNIPEQPWEHVPMDFAGPVQKKQWFILEDAYSKWTEVVQMKDNTRQWQIKTLKQLFSRYGGDAGDQDLQLQQFLLSYSNTRHTTTGKAPAALFLSHLLPTQLNCLKPDPRNKMEIEVWKQKVYHHAKVRTRWCPSVVERKTGKLSYEVLIGGQMKQKHADQLLSRSGATDDKPTPTMGNQQQEVEVHVTVRGKHVLLWLQESGCLAVRKESLSSSENKIHALDM